MKKLYKYLFLSGLAVAACVTPAKADGYRCFIDFHAGATPTIDRPPFQYSDNSWSRCEYSRPALGAGINITGGYQINKMFFAGLGFGGYTVLNYPDDISGGKVPNLIFPFYGDIRWTLDVEQTVTPFVDLKIGYQGTVKVGDGELDWSDNQGYVAYKGGTYFVPSVGVRFGKASGFNLGFGYNCNMPRVYTQKQDGVEREVLKKSSGQFMVILGADF